MSKNDIRRIEKMKKPKSFKERFQIFLIRLRGLFPTLVWRGLVVKVDGDRHLHNDIVIRGVAVVPTASGAQVNINDERLIVRFESR